MTQQTAIQFNNKTLPHILERFPAIGRNYSEEELVGLAVDREYLITDPQPNFDFWIITEQDLLLNYGTVSNDVETRFVPVTQVK